MFAAGHLAAFTAPPGQRYALLDVLRPQLALVPDEPATLIYVFAVSDDAPDTVWSYERYTDASGFAAHGHAPGVLDGLRSMAGLEMSVHHLDLTASGPGLPTEGQQSVMIDDATVQRSAGVILRLDSHTTPAAGALEPVGAVLSLWHTEAAAPGRLWQYAVFAHRGDRDAYLATVDLSAGQAWRTDIVAAKWAPNAGASRG